MRLLQRNTAIVAAGACLATALAACSIVSDRDEPSDPAASTPDAPPSDADVATDRIDEGRIGGSGTGFTIEVDDDWVEVDVEADELLDALDEAGFEGDVEFAQRAIEQLAGIPGVVYAFEYGPQPTSGFLTNLNGYCMSSPISLSLQELAQISERELAAVGASEVSVTETTAGSTEALRITYEVTMGGPQLVGVQYVFANTADDLCYLTFTTTAQDDDLDRFDQIAATLQLT